MMKKHSGGKIDLTKPGLGVGGYIHGGSMKEGNFLTPFPLDTSDHYSEGEYGKDLSVAKSGSAGGYKGMGSGGKGRSKGGMSYG